MASIRKQLKLKIKEEQKQKASSIRLLKLARKPKVYNTDPSMYDKLGHLETHRYDFRHIHIAYCMFFNNTEYEAIERKCDDIPNSLYIQKLKDEWNRYIEMNTEEIVDETVCAS